MVGNIFQGSYADLALLKGANQRVRVFVPVFLAACLASLVYVFARPAVYASTARLQLEAPRTGGQKDEGDRTAMLLTAVEALVSSKVLDGVAEQLGRRSPGAMREIGTTESLHRMLSAKPVPGTNVIELQVEAGERELPAVMLETWIEAYRQSLAAARDQSSTAALDEARADAERLRREAEGKRGEAEQFRRKYDIVSQERGDNQAAAQLRALGTALNDARNREVNAETNLNVLQENLAAGKAVEWSGDRGAIAELERRAGELRNQMSDLEQDFTPQYLEREPRYRAMRTNLGRIEQQLAKLRKTSTEHALQNAEGELTTARQTVQRLERDLAARKREAQEFTSRFSEYTVLANEEHQLQESYETAKQRLSELEKSAARVGPTMTVLNEPSPAGFPVRPDYLRDALIGIGGSGLLGLIAVLFVEFLQRPQAPQPDLRAQPVIHISYPPGAMLDYTHPALTATAQRLPETIAQLPRELSGPEVLALWKAATHDAKVVIAGLLGGMSLEEIGALRYEHIDLNAGSARLPAPFNRTCKLHEAMKTVLRERQAAKGGAAPLSDALDRPLSEADLEGLVACAACDAGLANPSEVNADSLRHTYFAYLVRQGARLSEIGEFIGRIPPAAFRDYGRLSPAGPGLPLERIDPVFPALRAPLA